MTFSHCLHMLTEYHVHIWWLLPVNLLLECNPSYCHINACTSHIIDVVLTKYHHQGEVDCVSLKAQFLLQLDIAPLSSFSEQTKRLKKQNIILFILQWLFAMCRLWHGSWKGGVLGVFTVISVSPKELLLLGSKLHSYMAESEQSCWTCSGICCDTAYLQVTELMQTIHWKCVVILEMPLENCPCRF